MSTISAGTTSTTTLIHSGDTTGSLVLKTNDTGSGGTTAVTIGTDQSFNFSATGQRITGDFSNSTVANRVAFQTSAADSVTVIGALPSGTAQQSNFEVYNKSDPSPANSPAMGQLLINSTEFSIRSSVRGSGTYLPMTFYTGGSERMRIDTSGNVGIGTTTMTNKFNVAGAIQSSSALTAIATNTVAMSQESGFSRLAAFGPNSSTAGTLYLYVIDSNGGNQNGMVINSSGNLLVGATSARTTQAKIELTSAANTALSFYMYKTSQVEMAMGFKSSTDTNFYIGTGSTSVGTNGVYLANTGTSWISNSDERLKENLVPITNAISKVSTLRSVIGNFIADESKTPRPFLIAQDVQQVLPEAIGKSEIDGTEYLGVSYTDTIPLLVAAIKEQQALIQQLQADVAALKGTS